MASAVAVATIYEGGRRGEAAQLGGVGALSEQTSLSRAGWFRSVVG